MQGGSETQNPNLLRRSTSKMLLFMPYRAIVPLEWHLLTSVIGLAVNMILLEAGICRTQEVLSGWELSIALTRCRFNRLWTVSGLLVHAMRYDITKEVSFRLLDDHKATIYKQLHCQDCCKLVKRCSDCASVCVVDLIHALAFPLPFPSTLCSMDPHLCCDMLHLRSASRS